MKSMTGFGKAQKSFSGVSISVEVTSVNRKQLDLRCNLPHELREFEPLFRQQVAEFITRGAVNIRFSLDIDPALQQAQYSVNNTVVKNYLDQLKSLTSDLNIPMDVTLKDILSLPQVISVQEFDFQELNLQTLATDTLKDALVAFDQMRSNEGEILADDFKSRINVLKNLINSVALRSPEVVKEYQEKLKNRVELLLTSQLPIDHDSLAREVAYFADRCDITEEMVRLRSHFAVFYSKLNSNDSVGRELDFLIQEIFREINTTGSKANDAFIAQNVVKFKTELEKIREQIQNIE
ncbi:MAG: YicC/YloC family endoribonuclease [Lentisphaeria bacterium]